MIDNDGPSGFQTCFGVSNDLVISLFAFAGSSGQLSVNTFVILEKWLKLSFVKCVRVFWSKIKI